MRRRSEFLTFILTITLILSGAWVSQARAVVSHDSGKTVSETPQDTASSYDSQEAASKKNMASPASPQQIRLSSDSRRRVGMVPGGIIVKLKKGKTLNNLLPLNRKHKMVSSQKVFRRDVKPGGAVKMTPAQKEAEGKLIQHIQQRQKRIRKQLPVPELDNIYQLRLPGRPKDITRIVEEYKKDPSVEYAEPNYLAEAYYVPEDPLYPAQWAHQNTAAESGWDIELGEADTVIAIIDSGVDYQHEDLSANIWRDPAGGNPGMDFVDINTDDYIAEGYQLIAGEDYTTPDNDPLDFHGHGTHCAGIAASANNTKGVVGVCPGCRIMPVRAGFSITYQGKENGLFEYSAIADAIIYATDKGADIISMSFGGSVSDHTLREAIQYAAAQGVVLVAAAGNERNQMISYPAGYEHVISVAATAKDDKKASYSNYGYWVNVAAPGGDGQEATQILSTVPKTGTLIDPSGYKVLQGTSMACPYVAGLAGLILSRDSDYTAYQVEKVITQSVDPIQVAEVFSGEGRVNVQKAMNTRIPFGVVSEIVSPHAGDLITQNVDILGAANGQSYLLEWGMGDYPTSWATIGSGSQVSNGVLGNLNMSNIPNGMVTLRLRVLGGPDTVEDTTRVEKFKYAFDFLSGWPQRMSANTTGYSSPAVADIDNDGDLEVLIGGSSGSCAVVEPTVFAWHHDGAPVVGWPKYTDSISVPFCALAEGVSASPALADLDHDGYLEIIAVAWEGKVYIWRHDGTDFMPGVWPKQMATQSVHATTPVVADIDGDGNLEIIVMSSVGDLYVWHTNGASYLPEQEGLFRHFSDTGMKSHRSPAVADLDQDGKLEIIVALGKVYAFYPDGSIYWMTEDIGAEYVIVGDIDHDNTPEVVAKGGCDVFAFEHDGTLSSGNWPFHVNEMLYEPFMGDINNDNKLEIVVPSLEGKAYVLNQDGGLFIPALSTSIRNAYSASAIADVDGDGKNEIVLATGGGDSSLAIYAWKQDGAVATGFPFKERREDVGFTCGFTSSPALADLDHDGKLDIIVAAQGNGKVYAIKTGAPFNSSAMPWPTYRHDVRRTGNYGTDTISPSGSIIINSRAAITMLPTQTLTLFATDTGSGMGAGAQMRFSNDNSTWTVWEPYATVKSNWVLTPGGGTKTVYAQFKDVAGNVSGSFSDTIIAGSPGQITAPAAGTTISSANLTLTSNSGIGVSQYQLWVGACDGCYDITNQAMLSTTLTVSGVPLNGKNIYVRLFSMIDNSWYLPIPNNVIYPTADKTPPIAPTNLKATNTLATSVTLSWTASTDSSPSGTIKNYQVLRNGIVVASPTTTTYINTGLISGASYRYQVRAVDPAGNVSTPSNTLTVGTLFWKDIVGVSVRGTTIIKTAVTGWGNGGAASLATIIGNGYVEFNGGAGASTKTIACGLSTTNANASYTSIHYALILKSTQLEIYEKGIWKKNIVGTYAATDKFRVERIGTSVTYKKNGTVLYTSTVLSTGNLMVDTAIYDLGATIENVVLTNL